MTVKCVAAAGLTAMLALAVMLLAGAGLLLNSFWRLRQVNPGFDTRHLLTFRMSLPYNRYQPTQAAELASWAVEEFPGNSTLQTWEASRTPDSFSEVVDLRMLLFGVSDAASTADAGGPGDPG